MYFLKKREKHIIIFVKFFLLKRAFLFFFLKETVAKRKKTQNLDEAVNLCQELFVLLTKKEEYYNYFCNLQEFKFHVKKKNKKTKKMESTELNLLNCIKNFILENYKLIECKHINSLSLREYRCLLRLAREVKRGLEEYRKKIQAIRKTRKNH